MLADRLAHDRHAFISDPTSSVLSNFRSYPLHGICCRLYKSISQVQWLHTYVVGTAPLWSDVPAHHQGLPSRPELSGAGYFLCISLSIFTQLMDKKLFAGSLLGKRSRWGVHMLTLAHIPWGGQRRVVVLLVSNCYKCRHFIVGVGNTEHV